MILIVTRKRCSKTIAPVGSVYDAVSAISRKVLVNIGISMKILQGTSFTLPKKLEVGSISIPRRKCGMEFLSSTIRGIWNIPLELESNWREPITHLYVGIVQLYT